MSEMIPQQMPVTSAGDAGAAGGEGFITSGRAVDVGRGWEWIAEGFALFKRQPGIWILFPIVLFVCLLLVGLVPLLGSIAQVLLMQVFMGGIMLGCRSLDRDGTLELAHLFAGFKEQTSNLLVLGLLTLVAVVAILIPVMLIMGGGSFMAFMSGGANVVSLAGLGVTFALAMLVGLALSIPVYMALWFAPALVVFHAMAPVAAMQASFYACLKNIVPFLLYGVIMLVLGLIAAIPFGLGFLVLVPVAMASIYTAYRDVFFAR